MFGLTILEMVCELLLSVHYDRCNSFAEFCEKLETERVRVLRKANQHLFMYHKGFVPPVAPEVVSGWTPRGEQKQGAHPRPVPPGPVSQPQQPKGGVVAPLLMVPKNPPSDTGAGESSTAAANPQGGPDDDDLIPVPMPIPSVAPGLMGRTGSKPSPGKAEIKIPGLDLKPTSAAFATARSSRRTSVDSSVAGGLPRADTAFETRSDSEPMGPRYRRSDLMRMDDAEADAELEAMHSHVLAPSDVMTPRPPLMDPVLTPRPPSLGEVQTPRPPLGGGRETIGPQLELVNMNASTSSSQTASAVSSPGISSAATFSEQQQGSITPPRGFPGSPFQSGAAATSPLDLPFTHENPTTFPPPNNMIMPHQTVEIWAARSVEAFLHATLAVDPNHRPTAQGCFELLVSKTPRTFHGGSRTSRDGNYPAKNFDAGSASSTSPGGFNEGDSTSGREGVESGRSSGRERESSRDSSSRSRHGHPQQQFGTGGPGVDAGFPASMRPPPRSFQLAFPGTTSNPANLGGDAPNESGSDPFSGIESSSASSSAAPTPGATPGATPRPGVPSGAVAPESMWTTSNTQTTPPASERGSGPGGGGGPRKNSKDDGVRSEFSEAEISEV